MAAGLMARRDARRRECEDRLEKRSSSDRRGKRAARREKREARREKREKRREKREYIRERPGHATVRSRFPQVRPTTSDFDIVIIIIILIWLFTRFAHSAGPR